MIESLIVALIYVAIVIIIGYVVTMLLAKAGVPDIAIKLVWAVVALVAILRLLDVFVTGDALLRAP